MMEPHELSKGKAEDGESARAENGNTRASLPPVDDAVLHLTDPPPSEVTSGRLLRSTLVNGIAHSSGALVTAILTPFLLHRLGAEQYAIWLLALGMTFSNGYLALADLGLPEAAVKFIAEARALGSPRTVNRIASTTTAFFAGLGVVAGAVIALVAPLLVRIFDVDATYSDAARMVFVLMALEVVVGLPTAGFLAVIEGAQRYPLLRSIDVGGRVLWAVLVVVAVLQGHGVVALATTSLAIAVAKAVGAYSLAHLSQPGLRLRPRFVDRATFRKTLSYGSFVGGLRALSVIYSQMDRAIIGIAIAVAAVANYEVAFRIQSIATLTLVMASSAVLPAAAYNAVRGDSDKQRELYLRGSKYAVALVVPVSLAVLLYAPLLIDTWVGSRYSPMAGPTRLFLIVPLFTCLNQVGVAMLIGLGSVKRVVALQVVNVGLNLALSIALAPHLGVAGVVLGTLIGNAVVWLPYVRLLLRTFEVDVRSWLRRIVAPNVPGAVVQVALGVATLRLVSNVDQLWQVLSLCAASALVNVLLFVRLGLEAGERRHLIDRFVAGR